MAKRKHKDYTPPIIPQRSPSATETIVLPSAVAASANASGVVELTRHNFASMIDGHPFAVIDVWAPSSAPCLAFAPIFAAAAARNPDIRFAKINADDQQAMVAQFNITSFPTLIIFRSNVIVYAESGVLQANELERVLAGARALDMEEVKRKVVSVDTVATGTSTAPGINTNAEAAAEPSTLSIESYLRPSVRAALKDVGPRLAAGGLVAIRDAFEADFAERMHRSLDSCATWGLYEGYDEHFHYHHHNLYEVAEFPADLAWCGKIFDSSETKALLTRLSGRGCPGPTEFSASWYLPGDHSLPHNDVGANDANSNRQVAFVWHLAKDWRSEWGGALFWCSKGCYLPPVFNTLWLFNVGPESSHFVTHVSPYAQGKRLAINGWWTGQSSTREPVWKGPDRIGAETTGIVVY
jgi:thioredoxin 1